MTDLERYKSAIYSVSRKAIQNGTPADALDAIKTLRKRFNLPKSVEKIGVQILREQTQLLQFEFVQDLYRPVQKDAGNLIKNAGNAIADKVIKLIEKARTQDMNKDEVLQKLKKQNGVAEQYLQTVYETVQSALSRSQSFVDAKKSGIERYKYAGRTSGNIRPFCAAHVGKIYTIDEIQNLDNGQGLSVQFFCGGYNCTHRWEAVI